jgi:hypothetical protein
VPLFLQFFFNGNPVLFQSVWFHADWDVFADLRWDQLHGDGKTAGFEVFCIDGSLAGLRAGLYDGETQSHAPALPIPHRLGSVKGLKQAVDGRLGYTGTPVSHRDKNRVALLLGHDLDGPLITRIADGVSQDI